MQSYTVELGNPGTAGNRVYYILLADSPTDALEQAQRLWVAEHAWTVKPA